MDRWQELEGLLVQAYSTPEYRALLGGRAGSAYVAKKMAAGVRKSFEAKDRSDWMRSNPTMAETVRKAYGFRTTKEWREAWADKI